MKRLLSLILYAVFLISCNDQEQNLGKGISNPFYEKAIAYRNSNRADSAFSCFSQAKDFFIKNDNSFGAGKCLSSMAYIIFNEGDYYGAQEISLQALNYFDETDTAQYTNISFTYNNLGRATYQLNDYKKALFFYEKAIKYETDDKKIAIMFNNQAKAYEEMGDYSKALEIYQKSIDSTPENSSDYARTLTNITLTKWMIDSTYNPLPELLHSLKVRNNLSDVEGLNSSYGTLADYYKSAKPDSSFFYAKKMLSITNQTNSATDKLRALRKLSLVAPAKETKIYINKYLSLLDSLDDVRNNATNKFALIRYEAEKHKSNFLLAQNENIKKRNNIVQLFLLAVLLVVALIASYVFYRKSKRQLQQEKTLEVKNTELKYVKKVHDRVANKVYQVISEVENIPDLDKDQLLDKLDAIYEISRDISYEKLHAPFEDFSLKLSSLFRSYQSDQVNISCEGNDASLWKDVNEVSKEEVFLVLQELLTNMDKHSNASVITFKFWQEGEQINIHYYDNGVGLPEGINFNNGLNNTVSRIKTIAGSITFETKNKNGLAIYIAFPTF